MPTARAAKKWPASWIITRSASPTIAAPIIVHGGGPEISQAMEKFGKKAEFVGGLRVTDRETLGIARMVLLGNINAELVNLIGKHGGKGIGLSGQDGMFLKARKKAPVKVQGKDPVDLGFVGDVDKVDPEILMIMAGKGYIPVISPIAADDEGNNLNVNADTVAGAVAVAMRAKKFFSITDVEGVRMNPDDPATVISEFPVPANLPPTGWMKHARNSGRAISMPW